MGAAAIRIAAPFIVGAVFSAAMITVALNSGSGPADESAPSPLIDHGRRLDDLELLAEASRLTHDDNEFHLRALENEIRHMRLRLRRLEESCAQARP